MHGTQDSPGHLLVLPCSFVIVNALAQPSGLRNYLGFQQLRKEGVVTGTPLISTRVIAEPEGDLE